jgi:hypothetical protein
MGKLRPIGSEKLQGDDKIRRMIEISNYNLNVPKSINENSSMEYKKTLVDGNTYHIIKEKSGYVLKKGLNESVAEYIEPIANRKYYSSYSQAFKRLNLIVKEVNDNFGHKGNISLFNESDDETKYYLNLDEQGETPPAPAPAPAPQPQTPPAPAPEPSAETPMTPEPEVDMSDEMDVETMDDEEQDEEVVTYKSIQKTVGKLAQKTREFLSDEENQLDTKQIKYIINSILSALPLEDLDEDDKEEIMTKFEGGEEEGYEETETEIDTEETPIEPPTEEMGMETPPAPPTPEGEMEESEHMYRHGGPRTMKNRMDTENMFENMFNESVVDKVLRKYFKSQPTKKVISESKISKNVKRNLDGIERLSESFAQEKSSVKLVNKYPHAKLLGRNKKQQLVFEINSERIFVTQKGSIL